MKKKELYGDLAHRLACAYVSHRLEITMQRAASHYVNKDQVGRYWHDLAEKVEMEVAESVSDKIGKLLLGEKRSDLN